MVTAFQTIATRRHLLAANVTHTVVVTMAHPGRKTLPLNTSIDLVTYQTSSLFRGSRTHAGSDVECSGRVSIRAPFDGYILWSVPPYGDGTCCDDGFDYVSTDSNWPG